MLIDTHSHLNFAAYKKDSDEVAKRALENNVWFINVGSQYSTSERAVRMAEKYREGVYSAIGLHPIHLVDQKFHEKVDEDEEFDIYSQAEAFDPEKYRKLAESQKVVAIGEIGLDYFHNLENREQQKKVFREQIDLAQELHLPIIIHCREAHNGVIEILREKKKEYGETFRGIVHSFLGKLSQAQIYTDELSFYLGFNGIITFDRSYDKVLKEIDLAYFLIETDCPYLAPIPFRGKRNEPAYVKHVAEKIAEIKNVEFQKVADITTENARRLFQI